MTPDQIQAEFKRRAMTAHPDHGGSVDEFAKLVAWRDKALGNGGHSVILNKTKMQYLTNPVDGVWVGASTVVYKSDTAPTEWKFSSAEMKGEMWRFLPRFTHDLGGYQAYRRSPDQILMADLIEHYGVIPQPHVSWMVSRLLNIACYLNWSGYSHCGISPEYLLVDLKNHGVTLTGPCEFLTRLGERPKSVPRRTFEVFPSLANKNVVATPTIDLMLIRDLGLELMGDRSGSRIRSNVSSWLTSTPAEDAFKDFASWSKALGERKFVVFDKTAQQIYEGI